MKLRIRYIFYEWKRILIYIPQMILGAIVLVFLTGTIAFYAIDTMSDQEIAPTIPVALVLHDDSVDITFVLDLINDMESVKQHFRFQEMNMDEATKALSNGNVCAIMVLPEGIVSSIMDGSNKHVQVILSDHDPLSAILMQELAVSGAKTLSSAQAGTYTMTDLYIDAGYGDLLSDAYMELDIRNLQYALVRDDLFHAVHSDPTGSISITSYYLSTAIIFFCLMFGIICVVFYRRGTHAETLKHSASGIGTFTECISSYIGIVFYQVITACLCLIPIYICFKNRIAALPSLGSILLLLFIFILSSSAYLFLLLELSPTAAIGVVSIFSVSILMMFISGCFIPVGLLPTAFHSISRIMPVWDMMLQWFHIISFFDGTVYHYMTLLDTTCLSLLVYSILFFGVGLLIHYLRRKRP